MLNTKMCPWLLYTHGTRNRPRQTLFSLTEGRCYETSIPVMSDKYAYSCAYGWLLMLDKLSDDCFLFNPHSMEKIELPDWHSEYRLDSCNLSLPPDDPNCIVLAFYGEPRPSIRFCKPGDTEWTDQELDCPDKLTRYLVPMGGKFYGLDNHRRKLMVLEYDGCSVNIMPEYEEGVLEVPCPSIPGAMCGHRRLLESGGALFVVDIIFRGLINDKIQYIEVKKFDLQDLRWEKVESLGDRAFFIGTYEYGTSYSASEFGIKGNCIYCVFKGNKNLYRFDMEDLSVTVTLPCPERFKNWVDILWLFPS